MMMYVHTYMDSPDTSQGGNQSSRTESSLSLSFVIIVAKLSQELSNKDLRTEDCCLYSLEVKTDDGLLSCPRESQGREARRGEHGSQLLGRHVKLC